MPTLFDQVKSRLTDFQVNKPTAEQITALRSKLTSIENAYYKSIPQPYKKGCDLLVTQLGMMELSDCNVTHPRLNKEIQIPIKTNKHELLYGVSQACRNFQRSDLYGNGITQNDITDGLQCMDDLKRMQKAVVSLPKTTKKVRALLLDGLIRTSDTGYAGLIEQEGAEKIKTFLTLKPDVSFKKQGIPFNETYNLDEKMPKKLYFDVYQFLK